jgi:hypothetical protein
MLMCDADGDDEDSASLSSAGNAGEAGNRTGDDRVGCILKCNGLMLDNDGDEGH